MFGFGGQIFIAATNNGGMRIADFLLADQTRLIIIAAVLLLIIGLMIALSLNIRRKNRQRQKQREDWEQRTVFIPVEQINDEIAAEFLTLQERILHSEQELDRRLIEKIRNRGPQALADIVSVYDKIDEPVKKQLSDLVREERLMERYARYLHRPDYPQGILVDAWQHFANKETLKDFVEMLASKDEAIQLSGTRLLSALQDPQSLILLTAALMWPEHFVPARVAEVFAAMGSQSARLLSYVLVKVDDKHKVRVLDTIAKTESPYPADNVSICLQHQDPAIRSAAASALGAGRMVEGVPHLMVSASDKNWQVRAAVAKALGMIGDQRSLPVLEILAQDSEGWVAAEAKKSLEIFARA